jgi:hypothetical protein
MTRFRLAATAALSLSILLVATSGGEAARELYRASTTCKTAQRTADDFGKFKTKVEELQRGPVRGPGRRGSAAATFVPVDNAKVIVVLKDRSPANGNNVVDRKDTDKTNDNGVAKNKVEFNAFGNYRATIKTKVDGNVVDEDTVDFGVYDRESGSCDAVQAPG